jgi:pyrroline-5-carboxylate reductase
VMEKRLGFLGYGNMGAAILEGLLDLGVAKAENVAIFDPVPARVSAAEAINVSAVESPEALASTSDVLVLAVKPQTMEAALGQIDECLKPDVVIISIAAGITIDFIEAQLGAETRVIRVMPNTPFLVHAGAAGIAANAACTEEDRDLARALFASIGIAENVEESDMNAVTALSGSGPAYFFRMVECLVEAAVAEGLDRDVAERLAGQTLYGAGRLLVQSEDDASTLRRKVTSPGGTTEAALKAFNAAGLDRVVASAISAAARRGEELGAQAQR